MKNLSRLLLISLLFTPHWANSQSKNKFGGRHIPPLGVISVTGGAGIAYYMGDLRDDIDMAHLGLGPSISIGALYRLTEHFSARGEIRFYQVSADQKYSRNYQNNLSFRTRNPDISLGIQADLLAYNSHPFLNPYLYGGVGATYLSPQAKLGKEWHGLAPLMTEGASYNRVPLVFTGGIGVSIAKTERLSLGVELCNNFVKSDYVDDVSSFYPDPALLPSDLARQLSDRSPEIGLEPRQVGGQRGGANVKDSYLFLQIRANYLIGNRAQAIERKKTRCPKF